MVEDVRLPDSAAQFVAVHFGHHDVGEDEVGHVGFGFRQRFTARCGQEAGGNCF